MSTLCAGVNGWRSAQSCHVCWMTFQVWRGWKAYAIKSWLLYSSIFSKKNGLLGYNNSTSISATFLMKVLIHIFVRERFTFATSHSEVWLSVLTYSLSNMWYIMCGHNMLKIDVKKTLENGEENGMIEESAIIMSHSTRPVSFFCLLFFSNCNFFLSFSSPYFFKNFELASVIRYHISDMT